MWSWRCGPTSAENLAMIAGHRRHARSGPAGSSRSGNYSTLTVQTRRTRLSASAPRRRGGAISWFALGVIVTPRRPMIAARPNCGGDIVQRSRPRYRCAHRNPLPRRTTARPSTNTLAKRFEPGFVTRAGHRERYGERAGNDEPVKSGRRASADEGPGSPRRRGHHRDGRGSRSASVRSPNVTPDTTRRTSACRFRAQGRARHARRQGRPDLYQQHRPPHSSARHRMLSWTWRAAPPWSSRAASRLTLFRRQGVIGGW